LVGGNKQSICPSWAPIESDGQLQDIERSKAFRHPVLNQMVPWAVTMALVDRRNDKKPLPRNIVTEWTPRDLPRLFIDFPCPVLIASTGSNSAIER
jgi:hypothetical protein